VISQTGARKNLPDIAIDRGILGYQGANAPECDALAQGRRRKSCRSAADWEPQADPAPRPERGGDAPNISMRGAGMKWDVARVEPLDQYTLHVELEDGRQGTFDMTPYLEKGVFQELKDPAYFLQQKRY